jgi:hypothetical protein
MSTSDHINRLPINTAYYPTRQDARVMSTLFGESSVEPNDNKKPAVVVVPSTAQRSPFKILIYAGLFVVLNLKVVDDFVRQKIVTSEYASIGVKTGLFLVVMLVIQLLGW